MKKLTSLLWAVCLLVGLASCQSGKLIDTVSVEGGKLQGVLTENPEVMLFKGVPYAAPPVGKLRWAGPQPVIPWEGVKVADTFGAPAVQPGRAPGSFYYKEFQPEPLPPVSEDCLFLNVWAPAQTVGHPEAKLYINGKQVGNAKADAYATVRWNDVKLSKGENRIEVKTAHGNDAVVWNVQ